MSLANPYDFDFTSIEGLNAVGSTAAYGTPQAAGSSFDLSGFAGQAAAGVVQGGFGAYNSIKGVSTMLEGGTLAQEQFQIGASSARAVANYNAELEKIAATRQQKAATRNMSRALGEQKVQMAVSGISLSSASFLAVANETLDTMTREILNMQFDADQRQQSILFGGEVEARTLENRGQAANYNAEVNAFGQAQKAGQEIASLGSSVATLAAQSYTGAG
jgi:hypothetical protein